jgi:hypothetical protein
LTFLKPQHLSSVPFTPAVLLSSFLTPLTKSELYLTPQSTLPAKLDLKSLPPLVHLLQTSLHTSCGLTKNSDQPTLQLFPYLLPTFVPYFLPFLFHFAVCLSSKMCALWRQIP